jgi:hypothetical protein
MPYLVIGIVLLMGLALWIVSKARGDDPFIAHVLHPARRDRPAGLEEDDDVRWRWGRP